MKMYVLGAKNPFYFFQGSKVVQNLPNWWAEFRNRHFVIGGGGGVLEGWGHYIHP